ncbi:MAG: hypothetical protein ACYC7E_01775 [Armatimonadota bacterium]
METVIPQVRVPEIATTMMASLHGAVSTWDDTLSLTDLFGYSGHAFILNIERSLCPSGPTAWDWGAILFPLRQMISLRRICATCDMRSAEEARELIWQRTVESIDAGHPAVLWDAIIPEFYLAYGYDGDTGEYLVQGPKAQKVKHRVSWSQLGNCTGRIWALFPGPHEAPDRTAARDLALRGAVNWYRWPRDPESQWTFGGEAWNVWIAALREEEPAHTSNLLALNQTVYAECRQHAAAFLNEQGAEFAAAAAAYRQVADALGQVCALWPLPKPIPPHVVRKQAAALLESARDAEAAGIRALEALLPREKVRA